MADTWRNDFLGVLAHLEAHAEQRDAALAALRKVVPEPVETKFVPLKAAAVGFCPETLRLWAKDGRIAAKREGGRWLIDLVSLHRFLDYRAVR